MFNIFKKKVEETNEIIAYVMGIDEKITASYRARQMMDLTSEMSAEAINKIRRYVSTHTGVAECYDQTDDFIVKNYEIVSESEDEVFVKRTIDFKKVKSMGYTHVLGLATAEIFKVAFDTEGPYIYDVCAA